MLHYHAMKSQTTNSQQDTDAAQNKVCTYNRTRHRYCHIFSNKSSKFHSWCADIGTQWGIL